MEDTFGVLAQEAQPQESTTLVEYTVGDLTLKIGSQKLFVHKKRVDVTSKQFLLLHTLALKVHEGKEPLVFKNELLFNLYGAKEFWPKSNSLNVLLCRLRDALSKAGSKWDILPKHNIGYQLQLKQE